MAKTNDRKYRMERPDSMKGKISRKAAHDRIDDDGRKAIRKALPDELAHPNDLEEALNIAAEWIERYVLSKEKAKRPPPSFHEQRLSRRRFRSAAADFVAAIDEADTETKKRIYHYFSDHYAADLPSDSWHEDSFDIGKRLYKDRCNAIKADIDPILNAFNTSKRVDDPRGQAAPHTYLFYRLTLIWVHLTGLEFTMSVIPSSERPNAISFINVVLEAAAAASEGGDKKMLKNLRDWKGFAGGALTATMSAVFRKINRNDPERGDQSEKKRGRSDSDQDRE